MTALLDARALAMRHGDRGVLDNIDFSVCDGEFIGVIGPNGAGKSSLLSLLAGVAKPAAGHITVDGRDIAELSPIERARRIAYLPQARPVYWSLPVRDLVSLGRFAFGGSMARHETDDAAVASAIETLGLGALQARPAHALSGGELTRAHLARLLASDAALIIADEPASALDPARQFEIMKILSARAKTGGAVIAAIHDLPMALRYCSRLVILNEGRIVGDSAPADVAATQIFESVFDVCVKPTGEASATAYSVAPLA